jgi:hypothetical protein
MAITLITAATLDGDTNAAFTSSIDSTYKLYMFLWNAHFDTDERGFMWNCSVDGGSNYNVAKTSPFYRAYNTQSSGGTDEGGALAYDSDYDAAQTTAYIDLNMNFGNGSDQAGGGRFYLFNPSNTTYVKHYLSFANNFTADDLSTLVGVGGYANTTSAINAVKFSASGGTMYGFVKMYGVG